LSQFLPQSQNRTGFGGGILIGLSLGLLWTPCVGPILASVISLAITGSVNIEAVFITLAYALGTAIPMYYIMMLLLRQQTNQLFRKHGITRVLYLAIRKICKKVSRRIKMHYEIILMIKKQGRICRRLCWN